MSEEELEEVSEGSSAAAEEYYEPSEEAIELESKELSIPEVEVFIERSELWDKMVLGNVSLEEGVQLHQQLVSRLPSITATGTRRRRRRK